ncbi:hypothetical protein SDC9_109328 [bioreactor metagenome]|uniref:Uncharacterized protein n=1 Tax=bioreactor metagenome TaxID=1076179 RepID=A0A645BBI4_9ZZZZ
MGTSVLLVLAGHRHQCRDGQFVSGQQQSPVDLLEGELAQMVHAGTAEQLQRPDARQRVGAGQRLGVVVEVEQQRLAAAGLDEAVGVAVELVRHRPAVDHGEEVRDERLDGEVGHRAGLRGRDVARVAQHEDVVVRRGPQRVLVHRDEAALVAQPRVEHVLLAGVQRDGHQQVERQLPAVVRDQHLAVVVDPLQGEVRGEPDRALLQQVTEVTRGDRLGERPVQRRDVGDVDLVTHVSLAEVVLHQEDELQRRDRALDRHVGQLHQHLAALERLEGVVQPGGALEGVEVEDLLVPEGAVGHARGQVGTGLGAGGDQEPVVRQGPAVLEVDLVVVGADPADARLDEVHARRDEVGPRLGDPLRRRGAERDEEVAGLVVVVIVLVHHGDRPVLGELVAEVVGEHGAGGTGTEDEEPSHESRIPIRVYKYYLLRSLAL